MAAALAATTLCAGACRGSAGSAPPGLVAAATSLRRVMPTLIAEYGAQRRPEALRVTYGASGDLRRQVQAGAPVDVVVFADPGNVDALVDAGLADPASRIVVATNRLVLIGPRGTPPRTFRTLPALAEGERIAIGDPGAVPAGAYAKRFLESLGAWDAIQGRLVLAGNVGAVLSYARRGEVAAAVVYETELAGVDDVVVLDRAEGDEAPVVSVVAAFVGAGAAGERGRGFLAFLASARARAVFRDHGFGAS